MFVYFGLRLLAWVVLLVLVMLVCALLVDLLFGYVLWLWWLIRSRFACLLLFGCVLCWFPVGFVWVRFRLLRVVVGLFRFVLRLCLVRLFIVVGGFAGLCSDVLHVVVVVCL